MPLKFMYITNNPIIATIAEDSGVDRIWIDLEYIGKEERQSGMNTVKSNHVISDVANIRPYVKNAELMVRINPLYEGSEKEINAVLAGRPDLIMLPMLKSASDAKEFVDLVAGRAKVMLLIETREAIENLGKIVKVPGIDEIHIGLNDLSISYHLKFMFELVANGIVDKACEIIHSTGIPYGFGGVAKLGEGMLPAEYVLGEHYRLKSSMVILSRTFCDTSTNKDEHKIRELFFKGIKSIRDYETMLEKQDKDYFIKNHAKVQSIVADIIAKK